MWPHLVVESGRVHGDEARQVGVPRVVTHRVNGPSVLQQPGRAGQGHAEHSREGKGNAEHSKAGQLRSTAGQGRAGPCGAQQGRAGQGRARMSILGKGSDGRGRVRQCLMHAARAL